jgi:hypothetical protein
MKSRLKTAEDLVAIMIPWKDIHPIDQPPPHIPRTLAFSLQPSPLGVKTFSSHESVGIRQGFEERTTGVVRSLE